MGRLDVDYLSVEALRTFRTERSPIAILTMCRALYTVTHREDVSKKRAAESAMAAMPERAELISRAIQWREAWREEGVDHGVTYREAVRFVKFVWERIRRE